MRKTQIVILTLLAGCCVFAAGGCSHAQESGFLGSYAHFHETGLLSKNLEYKNPDVDWSQYKAVMIDPVVAYLMHDPEQDEHATGHETSMLCSYYHAQMIATFEKFGITVVHSPGPGVIQIRSAVTQLSPTNVGENTAAQAAGFLPGVGIAKLAYKGVTGSTLGMGQASMEVEFLDSTTGQRLFGYVARRTGSSLDIKGQTSRWGVVETVMKKWATFLAIEYKEFTDPEFDPSIYQQIKQEI